MKLKKLRRMSRIGALRIQEGFSTPEPVTVERYSYPREPGVREDPLEKRAKQGVIGTLPERIIWKWLEDRGYSFTVQQAELGGRNQVGGAVVDFIVWDYAGKPVAIRTMGDYWHGPAFPNRRNRDDAQAGKLRARGYLVCDLFESEIYEYALDGHLGRLIDRQLL